MLKEFAPFAVTALFGFAMFFQMNPTVALVLSGGFIGAGALILIRSNKR